MVKEWAALARLLGAGALALALLVGPVMAGSKDDLQKVLQQARKLMVDGQHGKAVQLLHTQMRVTPEFEASIQVAIGIIQENAKDLEKALVAYRRALHLEPGLAEAKLRVRLLETKIRRGLGGETEGVDIDEVRGRFAQALTLFKQGEKAKAFEMFSGAVDEYPDLLAENDQGLVAAALKYYAGTAAKKSDDRFFLGLFQDYSGDLEGAISSLRAAIAGDLGPERKNKANAHLASLEKRLQLLKASMVAAVAPPPPPPVTTPVAKTTGTGSGAVAPAGAPAAADLTSEPTAVYSVTTPTSAQLTGLSVDEIVAKGRSLRETSPMAALGCLGKALDMSPKDSGIRLELAETYFVLSKNGNEAATSQTIELCRQLMKKKGTPEADRALQIYMSIMPPAERRAQQVYEYFQAKRAAGGE